MNRSLFCIWIVFSTAFFACGDSAEKSKNALRVSESSNSIEEVPVRFQRFEQDLFKFTIENFSKDTINCYKKYGSFLDLFSSQIIRVGNKKSPMFREGILGFINDPDIKSVKAEVDKQFAITDTIQSELTSAFNLYHKAFPDRLIPNIYTMISGFNYNIVVADSSLSIGLDMYLGKQCKFYELLSFPKYKVAKMTREFIVPDALRSWMISSFEMKIVNDELVEHMIYQGKMIYSTQQFLPNESEANLLSFTESELEWCSNNEEKIWSHFIDKKLFFSKDFNNQLVYINDGPFTKGFPPEAPARIGVWLGFQLVKSYMNKYKDVTLPEIMLEQDAHKIFNSSGYKPSKV
jgi:hypothetical protein